MKLCKFFGVTLIIIKVGKRSTSAKIFVDLAARWRLWSTSSRDRICFVSALHRFDREDKQRLIRSELRRIAKILKKTPTMQEYRRNNGRISVHQITYFYGDWTTALTDAGLEPNDNKPPHTPTDRDDLISEFVRVANELGRVPPMLLFRSKAKYSWTPYKTAFGSWKKAVDHIVSECADKLTFIVERAALGDVNPLSGSEKPLPIQCSVMNEPRNEIETIALFSVFAERMGFKIKKIQAAFPDAVLVRNGQELFVEFEFLSSNFLQHGHSVRPGLVCICWRKDVELNGIEVISLEEYVRGFK